MASQFHRLYFLSTVIFQCHLPWSFVPPFRYSRFLSLILVCEPLIQLSDLMYFLLLSYFSVKWQLPLELKNLLFESFENNNLKGNLILHFFSFCCPYHPLSLFFFKCNFDMNYDQLYICLLYPVPPPRRRSFHFERIFILSKLCCLAFASFMLRGFIPKDHNHFRST